MRIRHLAIALMLWLVPVTAWAHPHEWIDVASEVLFDGKGQVTGIRHHWRFDEAFTAFALQGLDSDGDGAYSAAELEPLARENVESLAEYDFFTFLSVGEYRAGFAAPTDYELEFDDEYRLTLHFTLPLAQPFLTRGELLLQVYDPEYYIAFAMPSAAAVRLVGAPPVCRLSVKPAGAPDGDAAAALAAIGPDQRDLPEELQDLATGIDNRAAVNCGGPTIAGAGDEPGTGGDVEATAAAEQIAAVGGSTGDLMALPAAEAVPESTPERAATAPSAGLFARIAALQTSFNAGVTESLKALKSDGSAAWWLGGLSFLYGIAHAAGPGHGKVVISSYLLANEQRVRRGIAIAFLSALFQALVAIGIVGFMAVLLNMTSMAITETARLLEAGSFALVAALGIYLIVAKGRQAWAMLRGGTGIAPGAVGHGHRHVHSHGHAEHGHRHAARHGHGCGCAHHVEPSSVEAGGWAGAATAILSVGLRPCSGALVVLVFALAQGIFWAGIASTFLMALGTAITVAALAALAVGAKDLARRLAQGEGRRSGQVMLALEFLAALFIAALGATLFAATLSA